MINIGKVINNKLSSYVSGRCYPLVAEYTTKKPFICYNRVSATPETTKDRMMYELEHIVQVNIVTDDYDSGIALVEKVCDEFDDFEGTINGITISECNINSIADFYIDDAYVQQININIKTK